MPLLSVILITHNRADQLMACVRKLSEMSACGTDFELIVVLDTCSDGSLEHLHAFRAESGMQLITQPVQVGNPAQARNRGADLATGSVLLFLDDDVHPAPELLNAHLRGQQTSDVVIGYLKPGLDGRGDWWQLGARIWWEDRFTAMRQPGYVMSFRDLFSANFSVKTSLFRQVGGFDGECPRLEDYELGIRLLKAGARFSFAEDASVTHMETGTLDTWLRRAALEALGEVQMGKKHRDFRKAIFRDRLYISDPEAALGEARVRAMAFKRSTLIRMMVRLASFCLPVLELVRARHLWRLLMAGVHEYSYWECIARQFTTESEFVSWVEG